ncbi:hypothetical protein ACTFIY_007849 [Dictyostelium cf. discoideum]
MKNLLIIKHSKYSSSIPYLSMIMKEVYRLYPVGVLGLPIFIDSDIEIDGFKIKKGTQIIKNFYQSNRHEDFFKLPNHFIPERFIESGNKFIYGCGDTNLLQFGIGNRDCIGKSLATCEIFTLLETLINRYEFLNPTPSIPLNDKGPNRLPIFGNLHQIKKDPHIQFQKWYKKYGEIYSIRLGNIETVVLTGYPIFKKAFIDNSEIFSPRFQQLSRLETHGCTNLI